MAETDVGRVDQDVAEIKGDLRRVLEAVAELRGGFEQMDKRMADLGARMASVEALQRWALGLWSVLVLAVLGLYFKGGAP